MSRIQSSFELLQHSLARQSKSLAFSLARCRLDCQPGPGLCRLLIGFRLLRFDGFALPSPGHFSNYSSGDGDEFVAVLYCIATWIPICNYKNGTLRKSNVCLLPVGVSFRRNGWEILRLLRGAAREYLRGPLNPAPGAEIGRLPTQIAVRCSDSSRGQEKSPPLRIL